MRSFLLLLPAIAIASSFDMKCSINKKPWSIFGSVDTCVVNSLNIETSNETVTSINGNTEPLPNVFGFWVENQNVNFVPRDIEKFLPNLKGIYIYNSKLQAIRQSNLKPFSSLISLIIPNNQIEILPDNLFGFNPELRRLNMDYNSKLRAVGENVIGGKMDDVSFRSSGCLNQFAVNGKDSLRSLQTAIKTNCLTPNQLKQILFEEEFDKMEAKITNCESERDSLQQSLYSSDGNLDAAIEMLRTSNRSNEIRRTNLTCSDHLDPEEENNCFAVGFRISSANMTIENVDLKWNLNTLRSFTAYKQQTLFLPTNLGTKFPALLVLNVTFSGLFEIDSNVLQNLQKLQVLVLRNNKLRDVPVDAFGHLTSLTKLDLSVNRIEQLELGIFRQIVKLEELNLGMNLLTTLHAEMFANLSSLKVLDLSHNQLQFLSSNLLSQLPQIKQVDLRDNVCINSEFPNATMKSIETAIIDNCVPPIELICSSKAGGTKREENSECKARDLTIEYPNTRISNIGLPNGTSSLEIISLIIVDQSMEFMPSKLSIAFPNLLIIVVQRSKLRSISSSDFEGFKSLKKIVITDNNLSSIGQGAFNDLKQLELLDLSSNNIIKLPPKIFQPLETVQSIILSSNLIGKFTADFMPRKNIIKDFKIDNNKLEVIETKTLRYLRLANVIDFSGNICIDMKFDKTFKSRRALLELSEEINLMCSPSED